MTQCPLRQLLPMWRMNFADHSPPSSAEIKNINTTVPLTYYYCYNYYYYYYLFT